MGLVLEGVVERRQLGGLDSPSAVAISQSASQTFFGSSGPCRYVPIVFCLARSLMARVPVVAVAPHDASQRVGTRAQVRAPAVILKSRERSRIGSIIQGDLDRDVADQPWTRVADRVHVEQSHAFDLLLADRIRVPEQLIPTAHAQDERPVRGRLVQCRALAQQQILGAQPLVAVLAATDVEDIVSGSVQWFAESAARQLEADPAPLTTAAQHQQVAAIGIDVHQVRVQRTHPQRASGARR